MTATDKTGAGSYAAEIERSLGPERVARSRGWADEWVRGLIQGQMDGQKMLSESIFVFPWWLWVGTAIAILFIIVIALAGLGNVVVGALAESAWGVFTVGMSIPIARMPRRASGS